MPLPVLRACQRTAAFPAKRCAGGPWGQASHWSSATTSSVPRRLVQVNMRPSPGYLRGCCGA
eukprot:1919485-Alexandrium_andersonii.AAC.1